jgi:biopolymer transport protein ExbB
MATTTSTAKNESPGGGIGAILPYIIIPILFLIAYFLIYKMWLGDGSNFVGGSNHNDPLPGNYKGMVYKGGPIVPVLMTLALTVIVFIIERFLTINRASGSGNVDTFLKKVKMLISKNDINGAMAECDKQKGSVANVMRNGLRKYAEMSTETGLDKEQKVLAIQKEIEDATALELPMLEKNLGILATITNVATLVGLLGTVIGMIRAFAALSNSGAPDASALATGISEALINTALGIGTSAVAIIFYNMFTTRIDGLTYRIDEAGMSLSQTFAATQK